VPYGAPGDLLEVEIAEVRKNFARARLLRVIEASPVRVKPPCPYHFQPDHPQEYFCGGCTWQHMNYPFHLDAKRQLVQETLERIGQVEDVEVLPTLGMADPWRYRNKVQVPVGWNGRQLFTGFFSPGSHHIVPIEDCLVQTELSVRLINRSRDLLAEAGVPGYDEERHTGVVRHLLVRTNRANQAMLVFVTRTAELPRQREIVRRLSEEFPGLAGVHQNVNPGRTNVILGREWNSLGGAAYIEERLGALRFRLSPGSFFQVNTLQAEVLYEQARKQAGRGGETLLDLYCGVGGIALWLASGFKQVIGVDSVRNAVDDAVHNAQLNRIGNARFMASPAERFLASYRGPGQSLTVVLDPPRSGCEPGVLQALARLRPRTVVYVSCDPGTLARDIAILGKSGFRLEEAQPVDLFPQTAHIETIVRLSSRPRT
jgi:23S rRNA (uracil1939-C5)-methyltransferase